MLDGAMTLHVYTYADTLNQWHIYLLVYKSTEPGHSCSLMISYMEQMVHTAHVYELHCLIGFFPLS